MSYKKIELSISYTTRPIRKREINEVDYFFIKKKNFVDLKNKNYNDKTIMQIETDAQKLFKSTICARQGLKINL